MRTIASDVYERRMRLPDVWSDLDLVFPRPLGRAADHEQLNRRAFQTACRTAKLPSGLTLYSLRHTFATLGLASGATTQEVSDALGYASPALVLSTYGHAVPEKRAEVFSKLGALVFGAQG